LCSSDLMVTGFNFTYNPFGSREQYNMTQHNTYSDTTGPHIVFIVYKYKIDVLYSIACNKGCRVSMPAVLCGLEDIGGNVGNIFVCKTDSRCRYAVLPVRDLVDHGFFVEPSRHVLFNGNFFEGVVKDD